jgi:hypothetical protein
MDDRIEIESQDYVSIEDETEDALAEKFTLLMIESEEIEIDREFEKASQTLTSNSSHIDRLEIVVKWMNEKNAC